MATNHANSNINTQDQSQLVSNTLSGVNAAWGITERGDHTKSRVCRTWQEYKKWYGGLLPASVSSFPLYCKRILDAGGIIRVGRAMHYTDPADTTTIQSTQATEDNADTWPFSLQVIAFDNTAKTVTVRGKVGTFLAVSDSINIVTTAAATTSKTVAAITEFANTTIIELNTLTAGQIDIGGRASWTYTGAGDLIVTAREFGTFANGKLWFRIDPPRSGTANLVDIAVGLDGYPELNETLYDVDNGITSSGDLLALSNRSKLVTFDANTLALFPTPKIYLAGGTDDYNFTPNDIEGDATALTGLHVFDMANDFVRIAVPEFAQNGIDLILKDYAEMRNDCMFVVRVPSGISNEAAVEYRNCTGAYVGGTKLDTYMGIMTMNDIEVVDEYDNTTKMIPTLADILALMTKKDSNFGAWWSFSGLQNNCGIIRATTGVNPAYNLLAPTRALDAQWAAQNELNYVGNRTNTDGQEVTVSWGNSSLQTANTLLKFAHVAELVTYIKRVTKPRMDLRLFLPNDIETWKDLYRDIKALMDTLVSGRAIRTYEYQGDQNVDRIQDVSINSLADIDNGIYKFRLIIWPTTKMEQIDLTLTIVNNVVGVELTNA